MIWSGGEPMLTGPAAGGTGPSGFRERFLQGEPVTDGVRPSILNSWQRSSALGLSPDQTELPFREDFEPDGRIVHAAVPVLDRLQSRFEGSEMNISLADANGTVLLRRFGKSSLARSLPAIQSVPGFVFAERVAGTNGIGLALAERRLIRVYGAEHFAERSQGSACHALPVRDPLSGRIEGVLCFGYPRGTEDPSLDSVIRKAAEAIERRLLRQSSTRERALLRAYLDAGTQAADGLHHGLDVAELADRLRPRDRAILVEKAAELLSCAQRAAVDVPLPDGRSITLVSRPMTDASGVEGFAVEVVLPGAAPRAAADGIPHQVVEPLGRSAGPAPAVAARSEASAAAAPSGRRPGVLAAGLDGERGLRGVHDVSPPSARGLVLVGEPQVGTYALAARRRLELLSDAGTRIGSTLEVGRTAQELAETAVPRLADFVTIDLSEAVARGEEPAAPLDELLRAVVHGVRGGCPFKAVGKQVDYGSTSPQLRSLTAGAAVLEPDLTAAAGWLAQDPEHSERLLRHVRSLIAVPLVARGVVLGVVSFYRAHGSAPFEDDDRSLAQELAARAALSLDNARRYTRERTMALALQRSLLPHGRTEHSAVDVAHRYLPAESDVGGDWYDVIPLSGTRIGLFVGDVVGHGMLSAATMGRLRTAARSFAELDFPPDEVLTHLDNLVSRLDREDPASDGAGIIGATCLYAVYDPTSQRCTMARAGHPPPALAQPDGTVTFPDLPAGPPLGLGGLPFEATEIDVPADSRLVLYTDGLIEDRKRDVDVVLDQLRGTLARSAGTPEETCEVILDTVAPARPYDDIALLVAHTHALEPHRIASWDVSTDPAVVSEVRAAAMRQLADWGLDEAAFAAELMLSELVTNAIRHGSGPIQVRLLHDRTLICEVSDASDTAPHLRRAATTDEGGRGLFLVAQLSQSWGTRYTPQGKIIWAECGLHGM
ncbi:SpoIIE family protein phosphatase [Streptomyces sp. NPDC098781]|uniref:SpoIIE family protein phosphatase n=1 Tax=Streptomyces sp. NPDC098781 TaxID=3366097 RepID=UPI0038140FA3